MKIKLKISTLALVNLIISSSALAGNSTSNFDTTATIESFCSINAGDINFGVVSLPLTAQSANAQMNVLCSNNTPYTINLAYGGKYGSGSKGGEITAVRIHSQADGDAFVLYQDGKQLDLGSSHHISCYYAGGVYFHTQKVAEVFGMNVSGKINDASNICSGATLLDSFVKTNIYSVAYDFGMMVGSMKGDNLAYRITIPGDSSKTWNNGKNSYSLIGTGANQNIVMNAQIVPDSSSSQYLAQDSYLDTVTATISY